MKITVIGAGYVGLVTAACFSEMGNDVSCVDINQERIDELNGGGIPIYEPGLKELIDSNFNKTLFFFADAKDAIKESEIIFIAVGTPMLNDGNADLSAFFKVAEQIGSIIEKSGKIIVSKSTVPVGTTFEVKKTIELQLKKRNLDVEFDVVSNPEFLKEGTAVNDFMKPDRVVVGAENGKVFKKMKKLYSPFFRTRDRFVEMDIASAEMTKYAANAMLATKISFINEIANICERVGADVNKVRVGIGSDTRIGYSFIYPGIGYGGTCFPKDIAALIQLGKQNGYESKLISSVDEVNKTQKKLFLGKILNRFGGNLKGLTFAIWGLSFKPETDDMREAPSVYIISQLLERGAKVRVYDPKAMRVSERYYFKESLIFYAKDKYQAIEDVDAMLLLTEWKEFRSPDFERMKQKMQKLIIFDGRNQYRSIDLDEYGFNYFQMGVGRFI